MQIKQFITIITTTTTTTTTAAAAAAAATTTTTTTTIKMYSLARPNYNLIMLFLKKKLTQRVLLHPRGVSKA